MSDPTNEIGPEGDPGIELPEIPTQAEPGKTRKSAGDVYREADQARKDAKVPTTHKIAAFAGNHPNIKRAAIATAVAVGGLLAFNAVTGDGPSKETPEASATTDEFGNPIPAGTGNDGPATTERQGQVGESRETPPTTQEAPPTLDEAEWGMICRMKDAENGVLEIADEQLGNGRPGAADLGELRLNPECTPTPGETNAYRDANGNVFAITDGIPKVAADQDMGR